MMGGVNMPQLWPYSPTHSDVLPRPSPQDPQLARLAAGFLVAPLDKFGWYWEWFRFWKHVWRFFTNLLWLGAWQDWEKEKQIQLKEERILKLFCKIIFHVAYFNYISCWIYLMLNMFNYISIFRISETKNSRCLLLPENNPLYCIFKFYRILMKLYDVRTSIHVPWNLPFRCLDHANLCF